MSYEPERRSSGFLPGLSAGVFIMLAATNIAHAIADGDPDARVKSVQVQNEQIRDQLSLGHTVVGLVLDDSKDTFQFRTQSPEGVNETCTGKYEVQNNAAHVMGNLTCSQTVAVAVG